MPAPLLYAAGIGASSTLNYGSQALNAFLKDPQNVRDNASRYFGNAPNTNLNQAPKFWNDSQSASSPKVSQKDQYQQLSDARYQRSLGNQTGFDDEDDNTIDDRARSKFESQQRAEKAYNRDKNSPKGTDTMATPNNRYSKIAATAKSATTAKTPPQYNPDRVAADLQNYAMQSRDRRYATDRTADVNLKLGNQKNQVDLAVGLDRNAVTRDVGRYTSDNSLRASNYKSYSELQAALNRNQLQSGDNRFETATKYGTQERINAFNRNTLDQTEIAKEQIKAGTYGLSRASQQKLANDKANFSNWKAQNDANFDYASRQNAAIKLGQDIGQANLAYSEQRLDRVNDRNLSMAKYSMEQAQKVADRNQYYADQKAARDQQRADFELRSRQIQSQIDLANRDFSLRSSESAAKVADIYGTLNLKNQQFAATRADVGYNRSQQGRSNLAF